MKFTNVELPYNFENFHAQELTNDLFILNNSFFVKRSKEISKAFLNWDNQLNVIQLVRNQPFTLPILEAVIADDKLWVLMPYFQNLTTLASTKINQEILTEIAKLIQQLHAVAVTTDNITTWNALKQLNLYCNLVTVDNSELTTIKNELMSFFETYQPKKLVLSHNDLVTNNFVFHDNKWYLIDWDFATLNDPLFDLASFASETLKSQTDIDYWLQLFNLAEQELATIKIWIKYQNLIWYHWAAYLLQKTKDKTYQTIAEEKLKSLLS